jgi:hypothetical protein
MALWYPENDYLSIINQNRKEMKTRVYLEVQVTRMDGSIFFNPLKSSESSLIIKLAKENLSVKVCYCEVSPEMYKSIFGL